MIFTSAESDALASMVLNYWMELHLG